MIPSDSQQRHQMIVYMLNGLDTETDKMNEWELNFYESIKEQFEDNDVLSEKQCEMLEKLYNKLS